MPGELGHGAERGGGTVPFVVDYSAAAADLLDWGADIESTMGYRRASSRYEPTILAEVMLKVLAHNVSRLLATRKLSRVYCLVTLDGALVPLRIQFPATL